MKNIKYLLFFALLFITAVSCDDFVAVDLPNSQLTGVKVFEDRTTAHAAMADVYAKLRDSGFLAGTGQGLTMQLGVYSDELEFYAGSSDPVNSFFTNSLLPSHTGISESWNVAYNQVYAANAIIEGVLHSAVLPIADKNQLTGEALFVRALVHSYLVGLYGAVPYVATTDYEVNRLAARMPVAEVNAHIIADLNAAIQLLPEDYLTPDRVRPNKGTASALLARAYLSAGMWAEASNAASTVLNSPLYGWETDLDKIFLKESTTTIWQLMPRSDGENTAIAFTFYFESGPPPYVALTDGLVEAFEAGDQRKVYWTQGVTDGSDAWFYASKYKQTGNTGSAMEYPIVLRLAEQYLIRAEARARQGELIGAKEDLNKIRNTAGLADTAALTAADILAAIVAECRVELFTEYGQRFFDLKRNGQLDAALVGKPGWNTTDALWPIPQTEILANPNMHPQNPGY